MKIIAQKIGIRNRFFGQCHKFRIARNVKISVTPSVSRDIYIFFDLSVRFFHNKRIFCNDKLDGLLFVYLKQKFFDVQLVAEA